MLTGAGFIFLAKRVGWFLLDNWKTCLAIALIALAGFFALDWYQGRNEAVRREQEAKAQESQQRVDEAKTNANLASNVANQSANEANQIRNANLNSFGNNYDGARRKFCAKYPKDCL